MHDGSITFSTALDNAQLEKDLAGLTKKIEKQERKIADLSAKRDKAKEKGLFDMGVLDAEKAKLQEIKDRLAEIRALAKDKSYSVEQRESYATQVPVVQQELKDQQTRVNALQAEWNKTENAVERYSTLLSDAESTLDRQKAEAGELVQRIETANGAAAQMAGAVDQAGTYMARFTARVKKLASRVFVFTLITTALRGMRTWMEKVIKTNSEARQSIAMLKGALLTLAQPLVEVIIPAFTILVNVLARVVAAVAQLVSALFGKTLKQSKDGAKALYKEAGGIQAVGDAAKDAMGSLAGFDEINTISTENAGAAGGGAAGEAVAPDFSWADDMGGMLDRLKEIADLVGLIAAGLALWKLSDLFPGALGTIAEKLAGILLTAGGLLLYWTGLTDAWENGVDWLNLIEMIGGLAAAALGLYLLFGPIAAGIALVVGGLGMLVTGFRDAMKNGWNLQNVLLSIAGALATGLGISMITGSWIPLLIAGIVLVVAAIKDMVENGLTLESGLLALAGVLAIVVPLGMALHAPLVAIVAAAAMVAAGVATMALGFHDAMENGINLKNALTSLAGVILTGLGISVLVGSWIPLLIAGIAALLLAIVNLAGNGEELIGNLMGVFSGLIEFITDVFTGDWEKAWDGVKNIFKNLWNGIVVILESAVNLIIKGLNWLISQMNKISFTVPSWVPGVGGKSLGISIPSIPEAKIPRLAQGAVIPPNREFMAVLGDQRSGNNLEAPEDLIRQIVREESGGGSAELVQLLQSILKAIKDGHIIMVDGTVFGRTAIKTINGVTTAAGKQLLLL